MNPLDHIEDRSRDDHFFGIKDGTVVECPKIFELTWRP